MELRQALKSTPYRGAFFGAAEKAVGESFLLAGGMDCELFMQR